jgi:N-acetylglucosamine-6-phosphate deacetylase
MEIDNKNGSLEAGKDADIVFFDEDINIGTTIVNGRVIFNQHAAEI